MHELTDTIVKNLSAKRAAQDQSGTAPPSKTDFRTIFISDVHLGTKDCKAKQLNKFLKHYSSDELYLVGDIIDGWKMRSGIYWNKQFNHFIRRVLKLSKKGTPIFYITGNHDEFLRRFANNRFENIQLLNKRIHITQDEKRILVIHGDQFDGVTRCSRWLKFVGDHGYEFLMMLNRFYNRIRANYGFGYWSLASFLKHNIKRAKQYIHDYEDAVTLAVKKQNFDGVICGHIHHAAIKESGGFQYLNTGDWVESCTAIVEEHSGEFRLIHWLADPNNSALERHKTGKVKNASPTLA